MAGLHQQRQSLLLAVICYLAGISTGMLMNVMQSSSNSVMDAMMPSCGNGPQNDGILRESDFRIHLNRTDGIQSNLTDDSIQIKTIIYDDINATISSSEQTVNLSMMSSSSHKVSNFEEMAEYKSMIMIKEMKNTIRIENEKIRKSQQFPSFSQNEVYSEVVKEIIPEHLLPRYATEFLQFPITR